MLNQEIDSINKLIAYKKSKQQNHFHICDRDLQINLNPSSSPNTNHTVLNKLLKNKNS